MKTDEGTGGFLTSGILSYDLLLMTCDYQPLTLDF